MSGNIYTVEVSSWKNEITVECGSTLVADHEDMWQMAVQHCIEATNLGDTAWRCRSPDTRRKIEETQLFSSGLTSKIVLLSTMEAFLVPKAYKFA